MQQQIRNSCLSVLRICRPPLAARETPRSSHCTPCDHTRSPHRIVAGCRSWRQLAVQVARVADGMTMMASTTAARIAMTQRGSERR
jgi:hypothetical protein